MATPRRQQDHAARAVAVHPAALGGASLRRELLDLLGAARLRTLFQPIVQLDTLDVIGYEALARGPAGGPLELPSAMFPLARAEGLLEPLDHACRLQAFRSAVACDVVDPLTLFVNVEPEALDGAPLDDLLEIAGLAPRSLRVVFEVTERAIAARPAELLRTVDRIRECGWAVALDDVGADPASLPFMSLLRPEVVKLDLRLIQQRSTPDIARVMRAVHAYMERSDALLLAEGIETEAHRDTARALGAWYGQGWLFGVPEAGQSGLPAAMVQLPHVTAGAAAGGSSPFVPIMGAISLRRGPRRLLIEMSKRLEEEALAQGETAIVVAAFQGARYFSGATAERYVRLAGTAAFVFALGAGITAEPAPGVRGARLEPDDPVLGEWGVVVIAPHFAGALIAREAPCDDPAGERTFEYALTYRREFATLIACELLARALPSEPPSDPGR